jgi:hypothetical protein
MEAQGRDKALAAAGQVEGLRRIMGEVAQLPSEALLNFFAANPELQAHLAASSPSSFTTSSTTKQQQRRVVPEFGQVPTEIWERIFLFMGVAGVAKMRTLSTTCARIGSSILERGGTTTTTTKERSIDRDFRVEDEEAQMKKEEMGKEKKNGKDDVKKKKKVEEEKKLEEDEDEARLTALVKREKQKRRRGDGLWEPHMRDSILARAQTATIDQWAALSRNKRLWRSVRGCPATKRRLLQALQDFFHVDEGSSKWTSLFRSSGTLVNNAPSPGVQLVVDVGVLSGREQRKRRRCGCHRSRACRRCSRCARRRRCSTSSSRCR